MSNRYSQEDVQQILRQATTLQQENYVSPEQLKEIAAEVGISADTLQQAEQARSKQRETVQRQTKTRSLI
jgi:DNA-binding transcriptional MerR regulator